MEGEMIIEFLAHYGYIIMFPLMFAFGPIVSIAAAFMASQGVFNVFYVFFISLGAGMIGDVALYYVGQKWGMRFVNRVGKYIGITERLVIKMEKAFAYHGGKIIIIVKSTTGLCWVTFVAAGIVRMPFWRFFGYTIIGGVFWSGSLTVAGYFFGYLYSQIAAYISYAGWVVSGIVLVVFLVWFFYEKRQSSRLLSTQGD